MLRDRYDNVAGDQANHYGRADHTRLGMWPFLPDGCIPPPPPDLDCGDTSHRNFKVLPPDPRNFDGNGDGIGYEEWGSGWLSRERDMVG